MCLAKPVDKSDYVRFTRGSGAPGGRSYSDYKLPGGVCMNTEAELKTGEALLEVCIIPSYIFSMCIVCLLMFGSMFSLGILHVVPLYI